MHLERSHKIIEGLLTPTADNDVPADIPMSGMLTEWGKENAKSLP